MEDYIEDRLDYVDYTNGRLFISMKKAKELNDEDIVQCSIQWINDETCSRCTFPEIDLYYDACKQFLEICRDDVDKTKRIRITNTSSVYNAPKIIFIPTFAFYITKEFDKSFRFDRVAFEQELTRAFFATTVQKKKKMR